MTQRPTVLGGGTSTMDSTKAVVGKLLLSKVYAHFIRTMGGTSGHKVVS